MKYCKACLQPDTRPDDHFSEDRICSACVNFQNMHVVEWQERYEILEDILASYHRKPGQFFDCIIGVSGGKDSVRQALWVRDRWGLNPLLVSLSYPPQQVTQVGVNNISNLIELGFDTVIAAPSPDTWRRLMRAAFLRFSNFCRSTELALYSSVPQLAMRYQIPLIFTGENQNFRDRKTLSGKPWDYNDARNQNTLDGGNLSWLIESGFEINKLLPYVYPDVAQFKTGGLQIIDLGWFIGDWNNLENGTFSCARGLDIRMDTIDKTGDPLGVSALDEDWVTLNQMIKYYKFGYGKVTDYVNEDIRLGRLKRDEAVDFVENYDGVCADSYIESFCEFIDITVPQFWDQVRSSVNQKLFEIRADGTIRRRFKVGVGL